MILPLTLLSTVFETQVWGKGWKENKQHLPVVAIRCLPTDLFSEISKLFTSLIVGIPQKKTTMKSATYNDKSPLENHHASASFWDVISRKYFSRWNIRRYSLQVHTGRAETFDTLGADVGVNMWYKALAKMWIRPLPDVTLGRADTFATFGADVGAKMWH